MMCSSTPPKLLVATTSTSSCFHYSRKAPDISSYGIESARKKRVFFYYETKKLKKIHFYF